MSNITNYFHETSIKDGIASIIQGDFKLKLGPDQMDDVTDIIIRKLDSMPAVTGGEESEVDMFYYLLYTMLDNIALHAKLKALEKISG